ncbi:unnamed protein product [Nyctereutes procyonoides]|uniref:(raccoon dog) hypothetical protein n=1 Tax=Nyctereutes procyonoides TaxID=34880 RepID=A0A811YLL9_NYCPR|nr:unnamed protein product [Nyctereutes procyonoides]
MPYKACRPAPGAHLLYYWVELKLTHPVIQPHSWGSTLQTFAPPPGPAAPALRPHSRPRRGAGCRGADSRAAGASPSRGPTRAPPQELPARSPPASPSCPAGSPPSPPLPHTTREVHHGRERAGDGTSEQTKGAAMSESGGTDLAGFPAATSGACAAPALHGENWVKKVGSGIALYHFLQLHVNWSA